MEIPQSLLDLMRKTALAAKEAPAPSPSPAWRAMGMQLAEFASRANAPAAGPAEKRGYLQALAVQAGRILLEIERVQDAGRVKPLEETADVTT